MKGKKRGFSGASLNARAILNHLVFSLRDSRWKLGIDCIISSAQCFYVSQSNEEPTVISLYSIFLMMWNRKLKVIVGYLWDKFFVLFIPNCVIVAFVIFHLIKSSEIILPTFLMLGDQLSPIPFLVRQSWPIRSSVRTRHLHR